MSLIRGDRDDKDKQLKKLKTSNDELRNKLNDMEVKNDKMFLQIEQSMSSGAQIHSNQPLTASANMGGKQKYNSIDVGYDETNFNLNQKNTRTNTNINSQKRILQPNDNSRFSMLS